MKKGLSILLALFVLASGMHLSLATHLCGGDISEFKISFNEKKASCGMCEEGSNAEHRFDSQSCCKDQVSNMIVDNNYFPSSFSIKELSIPVLTLFLSSSFVLIDDLSITSFFYTNISPHPKWLLTEVVLSDICVFRI